VTISGPSAADVPPVRGSRRPLIAALFLLACAGGVVAALSFSRAGAEQPASEGQLFASAAQGKLLSITYDSLSGHVEWMGPSGQHFITVLANPPRDLSVIRHMSGDSSLSSVSFRSEDLNALGLYLAITFVYVAYMIVVGADISRRRVQRLPRWAWLLIAFLLPPWGAVAYFIIEFRSRRDTGQAASTRFATVLGLLIVGSWTAVWAPALLSLTHTVG
jgi:hypothetical protein